MNAGEASGLSGAFRPPDRHLYVGAYAVGALDAREMAEFELHLAGCDDCARRLGEFTSLLPMMAELGWNEVPYPGDSDLLDRLLTVVARQRRRTRRRQRVAALGAAALVAIGPAVAVLATEEGPAPSAIQTAAERYSAQNPATGASAIVGLTSKEWGTRVDLELSGVHGPRDCHLIAVSKQGHRDVIADWKVPAADYDKRPGPISISGATAMPVSDISHLLVMAQQGQQLLRIAA